MKALLIVISLGLPTAAYAGHVRVACGHRVLVAKKAVVLQQVYPVQYYSVGAHLQEEALAEKIAQRVLARIEASRALGEAQSTLSQPLVTQRCGRCHDGGHPDTDLSLLDLAKLTCEERLEAVQRVVLGEMPPKSEPALTPDEAGGVLSELSQPVIQGDSP